jgi:Holliday junction resolvase RusA-like endonuclease
MSLMKKIKIKPLSINEAWKGSRYKTNKYKAFERGLLFLLPQLKIPDQKLQLNLEFGFSNKGSDLDNPVKLVQDILSKKYGFNDNLIYRIVLDKVIVKKGDEYIKFEIINYETNSN